MPTPEEIAIRLEEPDDQAAIYRMVARAFDRSDEANLIERLRADGDAAISLVATESGVVVGHVLLSPMAARFPALGLAPLAVAPDRQQCGIGAALMHAAILAARAGPWQAIFVLGDPAYYSRFGFTATAAAPFDSPYAGPHFLALALAEPMSVTPCPVDYAPAFAAL